MFPVFITKSLRVLPIPFRTYHHLKFLWKAKLRSGKAYPLHCLSIFKKLFQYFWSLVFWRKQDRQYTLRTTLPYGAFAKQLLPQTLKNTRPSYCSWSRCSRQRYESVLCFSWNATMISLCTVVEITKYFVLLLTAISVQRYECVSVFLP